MAVLFIATSAATVAAPVAFADDEAAGQAAGPREGSLLYFFSPDWRPPDLGKLAAAVADVFSKGSLPVSFQAFVRYEDFERQMSEKSPVFVIAPSWISGEDGHGLTAGMSVVAHPLRHGKSSYRKALMARPGIDSIDDLMRGSIAATLFSMGPGTADAVLDAFHLPVDSAKVVPVPKDVDALLALSFGQVDAALITSEQYDELARSNPTEAARLAVLAFSPEIRLPPVFARDDASPELLGRFRDLLLGLSRDSDGQSLLAMLGFDGFVADPLPGAWRDAPPQGSHATDMHPAAPPAPRSTPPVHGSSHAPHH